MKACKVCGRIGPNDHCDDHAVTDRPRGRENDRTRMRIARRDRWTCGLCLEPIDPKLRRPHPRALHVDHVIARDAGGSDDDSNLQASHAACNLDKGAA